MLILGKNANTKMIGARNSYFYGLINESCKPLKTGLTRLASSRYHIKLNGRQQVAVITCL